MDKRTDSGVSPVIATFLLLALSVVMITLVTISVMGIMGSYTPVYERSVGFTIDVTASNDSALITPVSGTDLPFLQSYDVYTDNGHWYSPSPGGVTVDKFNSTVTFINIVGHFPEYVDALVFSGKVAVEGGVIVVVPVGSPYYSVGSNGYNTTMEFIASLNEWYHANYPDATGDAAVEAGNGIEFINDLPIIIGNQPIMISQENIGDLSNTVRILISGEGNLTRAPGYEDALVVINNKKVKIEEGTFALDGMGLPAIHPAMEIIGTGSEVFLGNNGNILISNNNNSNGNGGGIYNEGLITINTNSNLTVTGNKANNGGGIYTTGSIDWKGGIFSVTNNYAVNDGGGVYRAPGGSCPSAGVLYNTAGNPLYQNNYP